MTDRFVTPAELEPMLGTPGLVVADTRFALDDDARGERDYASGHVPGAVYLHWYRDLSDPDDPVPGQLAPPSSFADAMGRVGIGDGSRVVAYDDGALFLAARLSWCLAAYGHHDVRILAGGFPRWQAEGRPVETGRVTPEPATFTPDPAPSGRLELADVLAALGGDVPIVDCRMDATWDAAGAHIPGARRLPAPSVVGPDGAPRAPDELVAMAAAAGLAPDRPGILYCGGGVSAAMVHSVLRGVGFDQLAVYDGSWSEWSTDPATPKEPHPG